MSQQLLPGASQPRISLRTGLANVLDGIGAVGAALRARELLSFPFLPIVTYHRVRERRDDDGFDGGVVDATPEAFEQQVALLARSFEIIGLDELLGFVRGERPLPRNPAMITFDDGYRECHDVVLPILRRRGVRAVFFIATEYVTARRLFWWDKITHFVKRSPRRTLSLSYPMPLEASLEGSLAARERVVARLLRIVKDVPGLDLDAFLDELAVTLDVPWSAQIEREHAERLIVDWDGVAALARGGMDIGSHTRTHRILQTLSPAELDDELRASREELARRIGRPVTAIAYPVGRTIRPDHEIGDAVRRAGYEVGFTNGTGTSSLAGVAIDPFDIRRLAVEADEPNAYFRAAVAIPHLAHQRSSRASVLPVGDRAKVGAKVGENVGAAPNATAPSLAVELVTDQAALEALAPAWHALLGASDTNEPVLTPDWMLAWWRVFGAHDGRALRVLALRDRGGELVGLVPLLQRPSRILRAVPSVRLELLASGEGEEDETCSDYLGVIAARGHEGPVCERFVEALCASELGAWDELALSAMNGESPIVDTLVRALRARGLVVETSLRPASPYVPLPATWDAYLAALSSSHRYAVRQSLRAFATWAEAPPRLEIASNEAELAQAMTTLTGLHRERWSLDGGDGAFASARFRAFHQAVAPALLARGALDVGVIRGRGVAVAAFYNLVWNDKAYFYQSGRKVDVPKKVRLGTVMHACLIRHYIERGLREYDFLPGPSRYKMALALATRPLVSLRVARPSLVESARRATQGVIARARVVRDHVRGAASETAAQNLTHEEGDRP